MSLAKSDVAIDNKAVRVTTWTFDQDESTGMHEHAMDYVVIPITGGTFKVTDADGSVRVMTQEAHSPYFRAAGVVHDLVNTADQRVVFVEVELKP